MCLDRDRRSALGELRGIELHAAPHGREGLAGLADAEPQLGFGLTVGVDNQARKKISLFAVFGKTGGRIRTERNGLGNNLQLGNRRPERHARRKYAAAIRVGGADDGWTVLGLTEYTHIYVCEGSKARGRGPAKLAPETPTTPAPKLPPA